MKVLDIDFKKKKLNFGFDDLTNKKIDDTEKLLIKAIQNMYAVTKDEMYCEYWAKAFGKIVQNMRGEDGPAVQHDFSNPRHS